MVPSGAGVAAGVVVFAGVVVSVPGAGVVVLGVTTPGVGVVPGAATPGVVAGAGLPAVVPVPALAAMVVTIVQARAKQAIAKNAPPCR